MVRQNATDDDTRSPNESTDDDADIWSTANETDRRLLCDSYDEAEDEDEAGHGTIAADRVAFDVAAIAGAWEATHDERGVVPMVGHAIANAFATDDAGNYFALNPVDGVASDRDSWFVDVTGEDENTYEVLVEEKAVGIVARDDAIPGRCRKIAIPGRDGKALYVNPAQIFVTRKD